MAPLADGGRRRDRVAAHSRSRCTSSTCSRSSSSETPGAPPGRRARPRGTALRVDERRPDQATGRGVRGRHELRQALVEFRVALRHVAVARQDEEVRSQPLDEHVADGVEAGVMPSGDDELGKRRRARSARGICGLPWTALADQCAGRPARARAATARGIVVRADEAAGTRAEMPPDRRAGRPSHHCVPARDEPVDRRRCRGRRPLQAARSRSASRISSGARAAAEQRDHSSGTNARRRGCRAEALAQRDGIALEVDSLARGVWVRIPAGPRRRARTGRSSARWRFHVGRPPMTLPCTKTIRRTRSWHVTNLVVFGSSSGIRAVTSSLICSDARWSPRRPRILIPSPPLQGSCSGRWRAAMAVGALVGWLLGGAGLGLLCGAVLGIPLAVSRRLQGLLGPVVTPISSRRRARSRAPRAHARGQRPDPARPPGLRDRGVAAPGLGPRRGALGRARRRSPSY